MFIPIGLLGGGVVVGGFFTYVSSGVGVFSCLACAHCKHIPSMPHGAIKVQPSVRQEAG